MSVGHLTREVLRPYVSSKSHTRKSLSLNKGFKDLFLLLSFLLSEHYIEFSHFTAVTCISWKMSLPPPPTPPNAII